MYSLFEWYSTSVSPMLPFFMIQFDTGWYHMIQERRIMLNAYVAWLLTNGVQDA